MMATIPCTPGDLNLPIGQTADPHNCCSVVSPTQVLPPLKGVGFVHVLRRVWVPFTPQLTLHGLHALHKVQFPSMFGKNLLAEIFLWF